MNTLFVLPVMDIIAGFIIVLVGLFAVMTIIAWQQYKRANKLEKELYETEIGKRAWMNLAHQHLKSLIESKLPDLNQPDENH